MGPEEVTKTETNERRGIVEGRVRRLEIGVSLGASLCGGAEKALFAKQAKRRWQKI